MKKKCTICGEIKDTSFFNKKGKGYQPRCKECNKAYLKEHYKKNKLYYAKKRKVYAAKYIEWSRSLKEWKSCPICGEDHPACLEFHHIDPKTKLLPISTMISLKKPKIEVLKEIEKCVLLCSNCHRKLHYEEKQ